MDIGSRGIVIAVALFFLLVFVFYCVAKIVREYNKEPLKLMDEDTLRSVSEVELDTKKDFIYSLIFEKKRMLLETLFFFVPWKDCPYDISLNQAMSQISREKARRSIVYGGIGKKKN